MGYYTALIAQETLCPSKRLLTIYQSTWHITFKEACILVDRAVRTSRLKQTTSFMALLLPDILPQLLNNGPTTLLLSLHHPRIIYPTLISVNTTLPVLLTDKKCQMRHWAPNKTRQFLTHAHAFAIGLPPSKSVVRETDLVWCGMVAFCFSVSTFLLTAQTSSAALEEWWPRHQYNH